jgi:hypothetical protein
MRIPNGLSGPFYVFVSVDSSLRIYERGSELNNTGYDQESMLVSLAPQADLVAGEIIVPTNLTPGRVAQIQFTVTNNSSATAAGGWYDSLYVSSDATFDLGDQLFARVYRSASVAAGAFAAGKKTLTLSRPGAGNSGAADIVVNLGATTTIDNTTTCLSWSAPVPTPAAANLPWLLGQWCGASANRSPTARATFGTFRNTNKFIFQRENF